jgi:hypothetical protein
MIKKRLSDVGPHLSTPEQTIAWGLAFPMDLIVRRYAEDLALPIDVAKEHEREIKRFLILCALNPFEPYAMRGPMDEIWHTFIIFTKDYTAFCEGIAGYYIHHAPMDVDHDSPDVSKQHYEQFLADYEAVFGEAPPPSFWPRPQVASPGNCYPKCAVPNPRCRVPDPHG